MIRIFEFNLSYGAVTNRQSLQDADNSYLLELDTVKELKVLEDIGAL